LNTEIFVTKRFKEKTESNIFIRNLLIAMLVIVMAVLSALITFGDSSAQETTTTIKQPNVVDGVIIFTGSTAIQTLSFQCTQAAVYEFTIIARGTPVSSVYPIMQCRVDSNNPVQITVDSEQWMTYTFSETLSAGSHQIQISFINDAYNPPEDRNLFVSKVELSGPTETTQIYPIIPATTTTVQPATTSSTSSTTTAAVATTTTPAATTTTTTRPTTTAPATTTSTIRPTTTTIRPTTTTAPATTTAASTITLTLGWSRNTEPDIAGYVIYYGLSSRNYTFNKDVGNKTTGSVTVKNGPIYYFALKAYNTSGVYSDYSAELKYTPEGATTTIAAGGGGGGGGGGWSYNTTTITTTVIPVTTTSTTIPGCLNNGDCDDGSFCNGREQCVDGICVPGQRPCGRGQVCSEDADQCWDIVNLAASFLPEKIKRPLLFPERCTWLMLISDGKNNCTENSIIEFSGPSGEEAGLKLNPDRKPFVLGKFIFLPVCIQKNAPAGQVKVTIISEVQTDSTTVEEIIETSVTVE
jgi:hypothetical protein